MKYRLRHFAFQTFYFDFLCQDVSFNYYKLIEMIYIDIGLFYRSSGNELKKGFSLL